jgi:hypothetical protein
MSYYNIKIIKSGNLIQEYKYSKPIKINTNSQRENYDKKAVGDKSSKSLNRTRNNMIRTINSNITPYSKFITLTVKENITDRNIFLDYFDAFRRKFKSSFNEQLKYLGVLEQQKRGAWHIHLIVFNSKKLDFNILKSIWPVGSVDIKKVDTTDNLGRYLAKYLTKENVELNKKAILKSRNLKEPVEVNYFETDIDNIAFLTDGLTPHFVKEWSMFTPEYYTTKKLNENAINTCVFKEYKRG